jgi:hypothetical protein
MAASKLNVKYAENRFCVPEGVAIIVAVNGKVDADGRSRAG